MMEREDYGEKVLPSFERSQSLFLPGVNALESGKIVTTTNGNKL